MKKDAPTLPPESLKRLTDLARRVVAVPKAEVDRKVRQEHEAHAKKRSEKSLRAPRSAGTPIRS